MKFKILIISAMLSLLLFSCSKSDETKHEAGPSFKVDTTNLKFDFFINGGSEEILIETNLDWETGFSVESNTTWCNVRKVSVHSRKILVAVDKSEEVDVRTAKVVIKSAVASYTLDIRQLGTGPNILVKASKTTLKNYGEDVSVTVTSNIDYTMTRNEGSEWLSEVQTRATTDTYHNFVATLNPWYKEREAILTYTAKHETVAAATCNITQLKGEADDENIEAVVDLQYTPDRGYASEAQPGAGIENTFDGDPKTVYHSIWSQSAKFPVTLEYFFEESHPDLDYIINNPTGGNGAIGKLDVFIATEESPEYTLVSKENFGQSNVKSKVMLNNKKKVTKVKFLVYSGGGNFVTCKEMEFFKSNDENELHTQLLTVFKDLSCSEVKPDVTEDLIFALPAYFSKLAVELKENTYNPYERNFRIRDYKVYSRPEDWSDELMIRHYSNLDNCTGIHANPGDELLILVGDTHGKQIKIQSIFETEHEESKDGVPTGVFYKQVQVSGDVFFLKEGVNKIKILHTGMLFLMYASDLSSKPIRVHIPLDNGIVDGFFDLEEHKTDEKYAEILKKATSKYFFVRGKKHMFYFHRETLSSVTPNSILSAVNHWDNMVAWQHELMGLDEAWPSKFNNHMLAISTESAYMWASNYCMGYIYSYLHNILSLEAVNAAEDNGWGPAHEMGHVHQFAINWGGMTEVSNNLFSNYAIYKLGVYPSRGGTLGELAKSRHFDKSPFVKISGGLTLRMNWQLWNYFHRCGYNTNFWPKLFHELRKPENRTPGNDPGRAQLNFAKLACKVANRDITEFFERWGFFTTINEVIGDYGNYTYVVTQEMIDETKAEIKSHNYSKVTAPFYYIEDRINPKICDVGHFSQFENGGQKITKEISYVLHSRKGDLSIRAVSKEAPAESIYYATVTNGEEAVAFEVFQNDKLMYSANSFEFDIFTLTSVDNVKLFAVQADGKRIEMVRQL